MGLLIIFGIIGAIVYFGVILLDGVDDMIVDNYHKEVKEIREENYQKIQNGQHITDGTYQEWQMTHPDKNIRNAYFEYLNDQR